MVLLKTYCIRLSLLICLFCNTVQSNLQVNTFTNLKPVVISNDRVNGITNEFVFIRGGKGKVTKGVDLKKV